MQCQIVLSVDGADQICARSNISTEVDFADGQFIFNVTITIDAIVPAQPTGPVVFQIMVFDGC